MRVLWPHAQTHVLHPEHAVIDQAAWSRINQAEIAAGEPLGKPRKKSVFVEELVRLGQGI